MIKFKDSIDANVLDPNAAYAVYYMDGHFANGAAVRARCPHAKLFAITVFGATGKGIFACDSETGDLTVPQTITWVNKQVALGVELICVYANLSRWLHEGLLSAIQAIEKQHKVKIKKWVADYNNIAQVQPWADAEQYMSLTHPNVDLDVALDNFFQGVTPHVTPKPTQWASAEIQINVGEHPKGACHAAVSYQADTGKWTIHPLPGLVHLDGGSGKWRVHGIPINSEPLGK